jgi:hypothetical protein
MLFMKKLLQKLGEKRMFRLYVGFIASSTLAVLAPIAVFSQVIPVQSHEQPIIKCSRGKVLVCTERDLEQESGKVVECECVRKED